MDSQTKEDLVLPMVPTVVAGVVAVDVDAVEREVPDTKEEKKKSDTTDLDVMEKKVVKEEVDVVETVVAEAVVETVMVMKTPQDVEVAEVIAKELETQMLKKEKPIWLEKELEKLKERVTKVKLVKVLTLMTVNPELDVEREIKANKVVAVDNGVMPNKISPKVKKQ